MTTQEILQGIRDWTNRKIVYDISVAHPDGQGNPTKYATLAAALGTGGANIPEDIRKGGMSIKYVQSSDNKYVQYMYVGTSTAVADFTNVDNWIEGSGSNNGAFNLSIKTGQSYNSLTAALTAANSVLTTSQKKGGMSMMYITPIPATYKVQKTEGVTTQPVGTELQSTPNIDSGVYTADQLNAFVTLPTSTAVTYYVAVIIDETTTYTTWVITLESSESSEYVQYRLTATAWTTDITKWVKDNVDYSLVEDEEHLVSIEKDGTLLSPQVIGRDFMLDSKYSLLDAESTVSKRGYYAMASKVLTYYDNSNYWCWEMNVTDYASKYLYFNAPGYYRLLLFNGDALIRDARLTQKSDIHILLPSNITKMYLSVPSSYKDSAEVSYIREGLKIEQNGKFYNINQINAENLGVEYGSKDVPIPQFVEPYGEYNPVTGVNKYFTNMAYNITRPCYVDVIMNPCELKETYFVEYNNNEVINLYSITPTKLEVMKVHLPFRVSKGSRIYVSNVGFLTYTDNTSYYIQKSSVIAIGDKNLEYHSLPNIAIQYKLELRYCGINETTDNLDERIQYLESKEAALKNKKWAIIGDSRSAWMYNETPYYALIANYLGGFTLDKTNKEILNSLGQVQFDAKGTNGSYVTRFIYQNEGQNPALLDRITITPDIISVYMGTNDFLMGVPLGEITDNDDDYPTKPHTYFGTLRKAILSIYAKFPNSMVVFMSPAASKGYSTAPDSNVPNSAGHVLADYVQAMKEVCGEYSIPVVDIFHDGDYTPFIESQRQLYYQDGLHESTLGHKRIANLLMPVLNNMLTID